MISFLNPAKSRNPKPTMQIKHALRPLFLAVCLAGCAAPATRAATTTDSPATEIERNKAVVTRHHEQLNRGEVNEAVQSYAEDTKNHGRPVGRAGLRSVLDDIYATFPDWRMEIVEMIAAEESVIV